MDFNHLIHSQRTALMQQIPKGASVVLSAGCSGKWYFDWFEKNYGYVEKHIGLELYCEKPNDLPENVEWFANSVDDMSDIATNSIDMIFSGQNIEHLDNVTLLGFLKESNRVLRNGGYLVIDSPNRNITQSIRYAQPEHTLELTDIEIADLVTLAGFKVQQIKGIWSCCRTTFGVRDGLDFLEPISEDEKNIRSKNGRNDPSRSFIWWIEAKKNGEVQNILETKIEDIYFRDFPGFVRSRFQNRIGKLKSSSGTEAIIVVTNKEIGYLIHGPYIPVVPGKYVAYFRYQCLCLSGCIVFDICSKMGEVIHSERRVDSSEMTTGWSEIKLLFEIDHYTTGLETRVYVDGVDANFKFGCEILAINC